jgi:ABC-type multidrug transport system ATPase subunit
LSVIGQRGVVLSGGQRARVSLARAVYSDADLFLMDDPLSTVDARVGQHIFDKCICGELSSRIRILVTHQIQHLPRADTIAVLQEGFVVVQGTYSELKIGGMLENIQEQQHKSDSTLNQVNVSSTASGFSDVVAERDMQDDEEDKEDGIVSWRLYWGFFRVGLPSILIGCLVIFYTFAQGMKKQFTSQYVLHKICKPCINNFQFSFLLSYL